MITVTMNFDETVLEDFEKTYGISMFRDIEDHILSYKKSFYETESDDKLEVTIRRQQQVNSKAFDYTVTGNKNYSGFDSLGRYWASARAATASDASISAKVATDSAVITKSTSWGS